MFVGQWKKEKKRKNWKDINWGRFYQPTHKVFFPIYLAKQTENICNQSINYYKKEKRKNCTKPQKLYWICEVLCNLSIIFLKHNVAVLSSSFCNLNQKVIDQQPDKNLGVFFGKILFLICTKLSKNNSFSKFRQF